MALSDSLAATALRLLSANGYDLTLRKIADTTPSTGYQPTRTVTNVTVKGILSTTLLSELNPTGGGVVAATERRYIIAASGLSADPAMGDKIVDGGIEYEIRESSPVNPSGTPIIHELLCA